MGLRRFLLTRALRRRQRQLLHVIDSSPIRYSESPGISLDNPVVITGAENDLLGSMAVFAWLIRKRGTMNLDWRVRIKRGGRNGQRHVDIYDIESRDGVVETFYFDVTKSYGQWSF